MAARRTALTPRSSLCKGLLKRHPMLRLLVLTILFALPVGASLPLLRGLEPVRSCESPAFQSTREYSMTLNKKRVTMAILATLMLSLILLVSAASCCAQATPLLNREQLLVASNGDWSATANPPEPATPSQALPKASTDPDSGWHVSLTPYLWLAGMNGTAGALGHQTSVHVSALDLVKYFNFGIMAQAEVRYNRIVMPVDFMWIKLSDDKGLAFDAGATSVKTKLNEDILTPKIGYRVIDKDNIKVDGLIGFSYWHVGTTLTLQPQVANGFYQTANWADAVEGAKIQAMLTPKIVVTIAGDAGGGGAKLDYQVAGAIGYKFKKFILQTGWRYMHVNYRPGGRAGFILDINETGLVIGATIPLK